MDNNSEKYNELYHATMEGPLGTIGAETTLPALSELLRTIRKEGFWEGRRTRRLSNEQMMIAAWATFRRDMRELRERLRRQQQDQDDLLAWVLFFILHHRCELARVSIAYNPAFQLARDENELLLWADWQCWVVAFLHQTLRDEDLDTDLAVTGGGQSGGGESDGDGDLIAEPSLKPKPASDAGLEY